MATYTPAMFLLLEKDTKDIFFKRSQMIEPLWSQLFGTKTSSKAYEDAMRVAGLGTFREKPEGNPVAFDDPVQGALIRHIHQVFALGFRISREMRDDDQFGIMSQMPSDMADSAADHKERICWDVINDGYTGTRHRGLDNEVLFSATHALLKTGGTASNILSVPQALSQTGLEQIATLGSTVMSDEGRFILQRTSILVIHPSNQHNAYVLLNTEYKPGSSNNDRSTVVSSRNGLRVLEVPYLSNPNRWSTHAPPGQNTLDYVERHGLEMRSASDVDTEDMKYYSSYRGHADFLEWRNNFGSGAL